MLYVEPNLIEEYWQPHKIEYYKENGKYFHMLGEYIEGNNVMLELDVLLNSIKTPL